jgi:hypothetical protein
MGSLPKKPTAKATYLSNWRRDTAAEKAAKPEKRSNSGRGK